MVAFFKNIALFSPQCLHQCRRKKSPIISFSLLENLFCHFPHICFSHLGPRINFESTFVGRIPRECVKGSGPTPPDVCSNFRQRGQRDSFLEWFVCSAWFQNTAIPGLPQSCALPSAIVAKPYRTEKCSTSSKSSCCSISHCGEQTLTSPTPHTPLREIMEGIWHLTAQSFTL